MSALLIIERNLHSEFGHAPSQIRALVRYAGADRVDIATWRRVTALPPSAQPETGSDRLHLHPVLDSSREALNASDPAALARVEAEALRNIMRRAGIRAGDQVVIPSATQPELRTALVLATPGGPRIVARILRLGDVGDLTEVERGSLRDALHQGWIHLSCETEQLAQAVQAQFGLPAAADFVLPCTVLPGDAAPVARRLGGAFCVGLLGAPRGEKGSYRLPGIVRAIAAQSYANRGAPRVTFIVQTSLELRARSLTMGISLLRTRLSSRSVEVEIIWGGLSAQDYRQRLFGLDAVLLPYDLHRYATSGSGVILDAVNAGVPVIHTRGMAMQELMSAGNALAASTDAEFAAAILRMAQDPAPYRAAAAEARVSMLDRIARLPLSGSQP
jgi:hypothetical protein